MATEDIKQAVEEFFKIQLEKDPEYVDNVTDSWLYDAESWFITRTDKAPSQEEFYSFDKLVREKFDELYDKQYGARDALFELDRVACDVEQISKTFERIKHHFKKVPKFNDAISSTFETLQEYLQTLSNMENGKIESLKD